MTVEMIEGVDVALKVQEACRKATGRALARLSELQTAADPKVRSDATETLNSTVARLLEHVPSRATEEPGATTGSLSPVVLPADGDASTLAPLPRFPACAAIPAALVRRMHRHEGNSSVRAGENQPAVTRVWSKS